MSLVSQTKRNVPITLDSISNNTQINHNESIFDPNITKNGFLSSIQLPQHKIIPYTRRNQLLWVNSTLNEETGQYLHNSSSLKKFDPLKQRLITHSNTQPPQMRSQLQQRKNSVTIWRTLPKMSTIGRYEMISSQWPTRVDILTTKINLSNFS